MPEPQADADSAWGLFTVYVDAREKTMAALKEKGVPTSIYYPIPLHKHRAFAPHAPQGGLPVCERMAERVMSLPFHPYMTDEQVERVAAALKAAI